MELSDTTWPYQQWKVCHKYHSDKVYELVLYVLGGVIENSLLNQTDHNLVGPIIYDGK